LALIRASATGATGTETPTVQGLAS